MNTLSKKQVIALFLGTASAAPLDIFKAVGNADTSVLEADSTFPTAAASGSACDGQGGCAADGEACARIQSAPNSAQTTLGQAGDSADGCIQEDFCGALGRDAGIPFQVTCWTKVAEGETAVAPTSPADITQNFADLEGLVTKTTINWDNETDILISPRFNYFDGWFIKATSGDNTGKWEEVDKPTDNRCFLDLQCNADACCAHYPNDKNRRCILKTEHNKEITVGPTKITPTCPTLPIEGGDDTTGGDSTDPVPENAKDDIAAGALSKANEELDTWASNQLEDAKKEAGYDEDTCDQACKDKFDADVKSESDKYDEFVKELKTTAGYDDDTCDDTCKAVFQADLLAWQKEVYSACKADEDSIECLKADELKKDEEKARGLEYYTGDEDARKAKDEGYEAEAEKSKSALVAAWLEDNIVEDGSAGAKCSETLVCQDTLCCGNMTKTGETTAREGNFCAASTGYTDQFKQTYTHVCTGLNAFKITSSIAAAVATAYYM